MTSYSHEKSNENETEEIVNCCLINQMPTHSFVHSFLYLSEFIGANRYLETFSNDKNKKKKNTILIINRNQEY